MFVQNLFEDAPKRVVVTYPGRFQPFHKGHAEVFANLQRKFGSDNVFIVTSNKTDGGKSPFNFSDKVRFMNAMGIPNHQIIETDKVYDLPSRFEPIKDQVVFITVVGAPDEARLAPGRIKKDGSPGYFQQIPPSHHEFEPATKHGYVIVEPEHPENISIGGKTYDVSHGTPCRALWNQVRNNPQQRAEFVQQLYGKADAELAATLDKIPNGAAPEPEPAKKMKNVKKDLTKVQHDPNAEQPVAEAGNRGYAYGFASPTAPSLGRRGREDDEYHVPDPVDTAIWYIRANGKIIKDKMGVPFQFRGKETARKAALTMMAKPFNAGKKFVLTTKAEDEASTPVAESAGPVTHRVGVTVIDPNHPMVSKRKEAIQKSIRITQTTKIDREAAINQAIAHYRRKGYKVLDHHYLGIVDDQQIAEGGIATVGWPDEGNHTGNNPPVTVGGTFPARPAVKKGSLVKVSGLSGVHRVMDIRGDQAYIVQEIPNSGGSNYVPMSDLRVWTNKPIAEFAPPGDDGSGDDGFDDETLKRMAAQWWQGDEDPRIEQTLAAAGWEIGRDEGYDNGGAFVVMSGDENGNSYMSWPAEELEGLAEGATGAKPGWMLRQDPELAKKVKDSKAGHQALKKWAGKPVPKDDKPIEEGTELKQAKRKYNQAAKDANLDQVGAGKKIDTMKKSLRQKDLDNKKEKDGINENAEELHIGDPVIITGDVEFKGKTGDIDSFGDMKRFVIVNLYNHGKHSFHSSDVEYNDYADEEDLDEDLYQYDKEDPYNSEFAPQAGMGRMTLRGWKQQMIKRTAELAQQMADAGQDIDKAALWDHVYKKLKSMNMDPIAQEIELAQAELAKIRSRGGIRSRAFNK